MLNKILKGIGKTIFAAFVGVAVFLTSFHIANEDVVLMPIHQGVHPDFDPYIDKFVKESRGMFLRSDIDHITMGYKIYIGDGTIGTCVHVPGVFTEININIEYWFSPYITNLDREALIFHELGHCALGRLHTRLPGLFGDILAKIFSKNKGFLADGCPISLMHWSANSTCYALHRDYYVEELFTPDSFEVFMYQKEVKEREEMESWIRFLKGHEN